jgi:hypothetical protein
VLSLVLLAGLLAVAPACPAATSGTATVTLAATASATIEVLDAAITLSPTGTDYGNNYVEVTGASGLRVRVETNSTTGMQLLVRCDDASPEIALDDLLIRTQTAPGGSGTSIATYTAILASDQALWTTTNPEHTWQTVTTDIRIQHLIDYDDAVSPGTTDYTNTLTYSVVVQ